MPDYTVLPRNAQETRRFGTHVNTTDATVTTVGQLPTKSNKIYTVIAKVNGMTTDVTTGQASYLLHALFKNVAGTLTLVGSVDAVSAIETNAAWDCTLDASGTDIRVRVTGAAATNIVWHCQVETIMGQLYADAFGTY
jgi:hypothetical protein